MRRLLLALAAVCLLPIVTLAAGCGDDGDAVATGSLNVMASATFLADIAQNVAGDRFAVRALVPGDADLHAYEPTPHDLAEVVGADLFIVNGADLEGALEDTVRAAGGDVRFVAASAGLTSRTPQPGEPAEADGATASETDPHFWLDPTLVGTYVQNIRDAFAEADPAGAATYETNAEDYVAQLKELDGWIESRVQSLPEAERKLVMDHMSHGYFADRYGFNIVGAVIPTVGTGDTPTARQLADLTDAIRKTGVKAIFVERGENPELAEQVAVETGITVVTGLRDHGLSGPDGDAPTYIEMMKSNTQQIVEALR